MLLSNMTSRLIQEKDHRFYRLITLTYKNSSLVLNEIIRQYHSHLGQSFEDFLNNNRHGLFHKRDRITKCCRNGCREPFRNVLLTHQWNTLFEHGSNVGAQDGHTENNCADVFTAKPGITAANVCDISLACSLITNIRNLADKIFSLLYSNPCTFANFLLENQHIIFHLKEKKKCCQCTKTPAGKTIISQAEWDSMYEIPATTNVPAAVSCKGVCCCKYAPLTNISMPKLRRDHPDLISKLPMAGPVNVIRSIRNEILAHSSNGTLDNKQFESLWKTTTESALALVEIIDNEMFKEDMKEQISCLKTCYIDGRMFEEFKAVIIPMISDIHQKLNAVQETQLKHEEERDDPIPKNKRDLFEKELEQWKIDDKKFVNTRASDEILKAIKKSSYVVVTGSSGNGKSFTNRHIALQMHSEQGFEIVPFLPNGPSSVVDYRIPGRKQVFVIDDICGKSTLNVTSVDDWSAKLDDIQKVITQDEQQELECGDESVETGEVKLLISSRLHVFRDPRFQTLRYICNNEKSLLSDDLRLTDREKEQMMQTYFLNNSASVEHNLQTLDFFPLLCKLSSEQSALNIAELFKYPIHSITQDLKELKLRNLYGYCSVLLCLLFDKGFDIKWFTPKLTPPEIQKTLKQVCGECGIKYDRESVRNDIKEHFDVIECTYVKKVGTVYSIIHDKIFDLTAVLYGTTLLKCFIDHASSAFIAERYILECLLPTKDYNNDSIIIPHIYTEEYFQRLENDLTKGETYSTFHNRQLEHDMYRQKFITYCKNTKQFETCLSNISEMIEKREPMQPELQSVPKLPLIEAILEGYIDIVSMLLEMKCDVNLFDIDKRTPIFVASMVGRTNTVALLLQHGAGVSRCNKDGESPLHAASFNGHTKTVTLLLQHDTDVSRCNKHGWSPLYAASFNGHTETVTLLLQRGADVSRCNKNGDYPIHAASFIGHTEIVTLLIQHGADVSRLNKKGQSSLFVAAGSLKHNVNSKSPLYAASRHGVTETVTVLLQHGADVSQCNVNGWSPLYAASINGHTEVVTVLLQHGADVSQCNVNGWSPLYAASINGHTEVVTVLLQHGADVSQCNVNGWSPLYTASFNGHTEAVTLLLKHGADVSMLNKYGDSPLHAASRNGYTETVTLLLQHGADVSHCDVHGWSPLYAASFKGHTATVNVLLQHGADVSRCNKDGESPLHAASRKRHTETVTLLLQYSPDAS